MGRCSYCASFNYDTWEEQFECLSGKRKSPLTNVDCDNDCNWFKPTEKGKLHMRIHELEAQLAIKTEKERK